MLPTHMLIYLYNEHTMTSTNYHVLFVCICTSYIVVGVVVFVAALATVACEASNRQRGGEMYERESHRIEMVGEILHLL